MDLTPTRKAGREAIIISQEAGLNFYLAGIGMDPDFIQIRYQRERKKTNAKLSDSKVVEIRTRRLLGETFASLAKSYNVTDTAIKMVIKRKSWKHVP